AMSQTQTPARGGASRPSVVGAPEQSAGQQKRGPRAVTRGVAPGRTSTASASAPAVWGRLASTTGNCSTTTWPAVSSVPCTTPYHHSYTECTEKVMKNGSKSTDAWWWCSNYGFKN